MSSFPASPPASDYTVAGRPGLSAISWAAIFSGAFVASALWLLLLLLGAGFGLSAVSPWSGAGVSAATASIATAVWLIIIQIIALGAGGYFAGRLRTQWIGLRSDETYFRDTAHGFLVWAVSTVFTFWLLVTATSALVQSGASVVSGVASTAATTATTAARAAGGGQGSSGQGDVTSYFVDTLFRSERPAPEANPQVARAEMGRILARSAFSGEMASGDKNYVAQVVAAQTGLSPDQAAKRVDDVTAQAKAAAAKAQQTAQEAADAARKAATFFSFWSFIALLVGAFCASLGAAIGGRGRDRGTVT